MDDEILTPDLAPDYELDFNPLYRTNEAHYKRAIALADQCTDAVISTFGVWAGVTEMNEIVSGRREPYTAALLRALPECSRILVGVPDEEKCHSFCEACKIRTVQNASRLRYTMQVFGDLEWRTTKQMHMKLMAFKVDGTWHALVGGRNLTDSSWTDASFELVGPAADAAVEYFEEVYKNA